MHWHTTRQGRIRRATTVVALALSVSFVFPSGAPATTKANVGGGVVEGTAVFDAPGIPPASANCQPTRFTLQGATATGVVLNTVITGFPGQMTITGEGRASCTSVVNSDGPLTITVTGTGPTGSQVDCPALAGTFTRVGLATAVVLSGDCTVNQFGTGRVEFIASLGFVPAQPDSTGHIPSADFAGTFVVRPTAE